MRFGIVGLGRAGSFTIPALIKNPDVEIVAAADRSKSRLERFSKDFQVATYLDIEELCKSNKVDAVYIATPTSLHKEHAIIAAEHRKHLIVEKPMAVTLEDAQAMIDTAERNGVHMVIGHSHSFEPSIQKIREIAISGELGQVRMINNWYFTDWIYRPRTPDELDTRLGGGVTFRQGAHQFDVIRFIGGGLVRSVRASTGRWDESRSAEGAHSAFLEFEDGTSATAVYNGYDHFHTTELTFGLGEAGLPAQAERNYAAARKTVQAIGAEEARIKTSSEYVYAREEKHSDKNAKHPFFGLTLVSCEMGDIRQSPEGLLVYGDKEKREVTVPKDRTGRDIMISELYEAAVNGHPPIHDGRWARANLEVCVGALESARQRKEVHLSHQTAVKE